MGKESRVCQAGVEDRTKMPGRQDQAVARPIRRILRIVLHQSPEIQSGKDIGRAERARGMSGPGVQKHPDYILPDLVCFLLELIDIQSIHFASASSSSKASLGL
jgi:hypothetical protein